MDELSLLNVPVDKVHQAQQGALVRLQLFVLGETHRLLSETTETATKFLKKEPTRTVDTAVQLLTINQVRSAWTNFIDQYTLLLGRAMHIAASIPFGMLTVYHNAWVRPYIMEESSGFSAVTLLSEAREKLNTDPVFSPQLAAIVQAAYERILDDGLNISSRIWRLDNENKSALEAVVNLALLEGKSAWDLAEEIEKFLGAGQGCPRWAEERLRGLTKKQIADGDRTGLFTKQDCNGQGVAYKALRLARTEIQAVHHMATDALFAKMPFVEAEQCNLSPAHAVRDECDDVVEGGEESDGVYPKGTITYPLHPHCMCFKTAVLMDNDVFIKQLRGWLNGTRPWAGMDTYAQAVGGDLSQTLTDGIGVMMAYWLWGDTSALGALFWAIAND